MTVEAVVHLGRGHRDELDVGRRPRRLGTAMLAAGLAIFGLLYFPQPLLPAMGATFGVDAAAASLVVSCATAALAVMILPMSSIAERIGRTRAMRIGLIVSCALMVGVVLAPNLWQLLALRTALGVSLAAVVAVAMGHLAEETDSSRIGQAMGLYVAGTCLGGVLGRVIPGVVEPWASWRGAVVAVVAFCAIAVAVFAVTVPGARPSAPVARPWLDLHAARTLLSDPDVRRLCLIGFCLMGGYVACYNYLGFRVTGAPFELSNGAASTLFLLTIVGIAGSGVAGRLADRLGRRRVLTAAICCLLLGIGLTVPDHLWSVCAGLSLFTAAFFAAHAVASGWLSERAGPYRSHASALYLTAYYVGSSLAGSLIGVAFDSGGWNLTATVIASLAAAALWATGTMRPDRALDSDGRTCGANGSAALACRHEQVLPVHGGHAHG